MNAKSLIGGLLAGAAVGVAIGMLFAPDNGVKTQKKLVKGARQLGDDLLQSAGDSYQSLKNRFNSKAGELAKRGKDEIDELSERARV